MGLCVLVLAHKMRRTLSSLAGPRRNTRMTAANLDHAYVQGTAIESAHVDFYRRNGFLIAGVFGP